MYLLEEPKGCLLRLIDFFLESLRRDRRVTRLTFDRQLTQLPNELRNLFFLSRVYLILEIVHCCSRKKSRWVSVILNGYNALPNLSQYRHTPTRPCSTPR